MVCSTVILISTLRKEDPTRAVKENAGGKLTEHHRKGGR